MKKYFSLIVILNLTAILCSGHSNPQKSIEGAWNHKSGDKQIIILIKDGYFTCTDYKTDSFISSWGGIFSKQNNRIKVQVEFNSSDSEKVGSEPEMQISVIMDGLDIFLDGKSVPFKRIDQGNAPLAGVWKISARKQNEKLIPIHQTGSRKTLKMLTGNRFQWFAIDPETKQFSGTGGGTYTFTAGKYTENIDFFSRDNKRVGAQLVFDGKIMANKWHHSGLSSKGDPIFEVWEKQNIKKD